ncbi:adenylyl-sulfate kinase [Burkholderia ubonensis]|uniref:Adenylyl-sulfate kinase n=1 Tax=Burkholderia ubonensis subsp. mesacidophila TaxID=265293 RepID=A0A2A4FKT2_9BURK|nr:adenylyl-sulfate kinase [Burkholderia ubonensis]PCE33705.1 adenylyl-sulfate kinase [Burkholderia ubonensis subsp. mesacidophila]
MPIAAMNGMRRAIAPTHRVLDASGAGAAGLLALRYGAERVVVLAGDDTPSVRPGAAQGGLDGRLTFADAERAASLATQGERFDVVLGPMAAGGFRLDLHYGPRLDDIARRYGTARATVLPSGVRYSAQLVEWSEAARLDADVALRTRDLGSRYAVDFEPVLEQLAGTADAFGQVRGDRLRALSEPLPFLTCHPGQHAEAPAIPAHVSLTASQRGRVDGVVWIQELVHDGIVIGRARGCSWLASRVELDEGGTIDVPVADLAHAVPFEDGEAAPWLAPSARVAADAAPLVFWLTGISGAGKTTIATRFKQHADTRGWPVTVLDGDALRGGLNADLGFSDADRAENVRRIAEVAALMAETGRIVVVSCISPKQAFRDLARAIIGAERFVEVFVDAPAAVAEARDPKGLYRRARAGLITSFTGIDSGYEPPRDPQIHVDTTALDVEGAVRMLCRHYDDLHRPAARADDAEVVA